MSPSDINICLHYFTQCGDWRHSDGSRISEITAGEFVKKGLLQVNTGIGGNYCATEKLNVFCKALCEVPLPIQTWSIPPKS